jgi:hypothetical protein
MSILGTAYWRTILSTEIDLSTKLENPLKIHFMLSFWFNTMKS